MSDTRSHENIVLIGFMGSGKSSVGRRIATASRRRFTDTDRLIVERCGMSIPEIFERFGEPYFRDMEADALEAVQDESGIVLATGGGIILRPANIERLHRIGKVFLLSATPDVIFERVSLRGNRPLLKTEDPRATIVKMLEERRPLYEAAADFIIETSDLSHDEVTEKILVKVP